MKKLLFHIIFLFCLFGHVSAQEFKDSTYENYLEMKAGKFVKVKLPLDGKHSLFTKDKLLAIQGTFSKQRLINGKKFFYDKNGILERIAIYKEGKYVGDAEVEGYKAQE